MAIAEQVVLAARECLDTPFKHQGRWVGRGIDCAGVVVHCARSVGADYQDHKGYPRLPQGRMLADVLDGQPCFRRVTWSERQPGDVLLMRIRREPQHLAVYVGDGYMIHSYQTVGKVVEERLAANWSGRILAVYRFLGA